MEYSGQGEEQADCLPSPNDSAHSAPRRAPSARNLEKKIQLADRVESAFLWNIADRVEYSGQGEERAFLGGTSRLFHAVRLKRDLTEGRYVTIARYVSSAISLCAAGETAARAWHLHGSTVLR